MMTQHISPLLITHLSCPPQLDIMEPKVPDDIYKTHLENNSESISAGYARVCVC